MEKGVVAACCCLVVLLAAAALETAAAEAADCNPTELSACLGAITGGEEPSFECCSKLKAQESCLCDYMKNPVFAPYVNSPNAKKVAASCGVVIPKCS